MLRRSGSFFICLYVISLTCLYMAWDSKLDRFSWPSLIILIFHARCEMRDARVRMYHHRYAVRIRFVSLWCLVFTKECWRSSLDEVVLTEQSAVFSLHPSLSKIASLQFLQFRKPLNHPSLGPTNPKRVKRVSQRPRIWWALAFWRDPPSHFHTRRAGQMPGRVRCRLQSAQVGRRSLVNKPVRSSPNDYICTLFHANRQQYDIKSSRDVKPLESIWQI